MFAGEPPMQVKPLEKVEHLERGEPVGRGEFGWTWAGGAGKGFCGLGGVIVVGDDLVGFGGFVSAS